MFLIDELVPYIINRSISNSIEKKKIEIADQLADELSKDEEKCVIVEQTYY